jgi:hypothetical protein
MEACAFVAVAGIGYLLNRLRKPTGEAGPPIQTDAPHSGDQPSMRNVYDSRFLAAVKAEETRRATVAAHLALDKGISGVVSRHDRAMTTSPTTRLNVRGTPPPAITSSLSGVQVPVEHFTHNNMVPFYKGNSTQNTADNAFSGRLEAFTGTDPLRIPQVEPVPLFEPRREDIYGIAVDNTRDAFMGSIQPSRNRAFEEQSPFPVERAGVANGETGDVYYDMRRSAMPPDVDALRQGTNPKLTFAGRVLPGLGTTTKRLDVTPVISQRPTIVVEQGLGDLLRTTGAVTKQATRPVFDVKDTNRQDTSRYQLGVPGTREGAMSRDATYHQPFKTILAGPQRGPATRVGKEVTDYGMSSIQVYGNERDVTSTRTYQGNLSTAVKAVMAPLQDLLRGTRKEDFLEAPRAFGNIGPAGGAAQPKLTIYDPEDVARTTIRETGTVEAPLANLRGGVYRTVLHDSEDVARTNRKETGLAEAPITNLRGPAYKLTAHDAEDVARTTQKETQLFDSYGQTPITVGRYAGQAVDPDDVTRVTGRETMDTEDTARNMGPTEARGVAYNPDDWRPAVTNKQVLTDAGKGDYADGSVGSLQGTRGGAYATNEYEAHMTHRQLLADTGTVYGGSQSGVHARGGYQVAPDEIKDTQRQALADNDYFGSSSSANPGQMSYESAMAARTNETRELLDKGRAPTNSSVKMAAGMDQAGEQLRAPQRAHTRVDAGVLYQSVGAGGGAFGGANMIGDVGGRDIYGDISDNRLHDEIAGAGAQASTNPLILPPMQQ